MAYRITVAPITFPVLSFRSPFDAPLEMPYSERPKIDLEVTANETVQSVLERASRGLGVTLAHPHVDLSPADNLTFVAFYEPADEDGFAPRRRFGHLWDLTTVDETGRAMWSQSFQSVSYDVLVRTADAGLLHGDPLRPYLILSSPEGDGVLLTWDGLVAAFEAVKNILATAGAIAGTLALKDRLKERLRRAERAQEAIEEHGRGWATRGARTDNFREMVEQGDPWSADDLAERLDTSVGTAEGILEGFGFAQDASGLWRLEGDEDASFMHTALEESLIWVSPRGEPGAELEERLQAYIETGRRPPFPWEERGDYGS